MKKLFFIASRFPFPAYGGREKTLLEYLGYIKEEYKVYLFYFDKEESDATITKTLKNKYKIEEIYFLKIPNLIKSCLNVLLQSIIKEDKSIQESIFWDHNIKNFFSTKIDFIQPDVIFVDMIRTAQYFEDVNIYKIFDMDDMISKRYVYLLNHKDSNILGNFGEKLPKYLTTIANHMLRNIILRKEAKLVQKREIELVKSFDKTLLVSPVEAEKLKLEEPQLATKIFSILPAVSRIQMSFKNVTKMPYTISFMGLLNIPHNEKGLVYFIENIFPTLVKKIPNIHLYIIGKNATSKLTTLCNHYKSNIILTGYLQDPQELLAKMQLFIAPLYFGTGIKIKILDSMALGLPIITTSIGVEGLKVENESNILIAETDEMFINYILKVLHSSAFRDKLGENAKGYINTFHNEDILKKQLLNLIKE